MHTKRVMFAPLMPLFIAYIVICVFSIFEQIHRVLSMMALDLSRSSKRFCFNTSFFPFLSPSLAVLIVEVVELLFCKEIAQRIRFRVWAFVHGKLLCSTVCSDLHKISLGRHCQGQLWIVTTALTIGIA